MSKRLALLEQFPIPRLAVSPTNVRHKGAGIIYGTLEIENQTDGELVGTIASMADFITFSPESFSGNKTTVEYTLDLIGLSGEIGTSAVITTNGGEIVVDFHITVNPPDVLTKDDLILADLDDFTAYVKTQPIAARQLFTRHDFMAWLMGMNYPNMDIYERFASDPNKERAVDNFLVFNGKKYKAKIVPETTNLAHSIGMWEDTVTGSIVLRKTTWGYAEADLRVVAGENWFKLSKNKVTATDFDAENGAEIHYMILPTESEGRDTAVVLVEGDQDHKIHIHSTSAAAFDARLDKETFFFDDKGKLLITNNTGQDLMIDIACEPFVKFDARRYFIGRTAEIEFEVKYGSIKAASFALRRQMYAESHIHVVAIDSGKSYGRRLPLTLWGG
ncbi:MAG: DUF5717 family protein [Defluviitaleaceae bacterium]|nr:DUF5717 family protein [Defluviitaleaceae bacterium]